MRATLNRALDCTDPTIAHHPNQPGVPDKHEGFLVQVQMGEQ